MEILKRVGLVVLMAAIGGLAYTMVSAAWLIGKGLLSGGPVVGLSGAPLIGITLGGGVGALLGAAMGSSLVQEKGKSSSPGANAAAWIVAVVIAIACFAALMRL